VDPDNFKAIEAIEFLAKGQGLHVEYYHISTQSFAEAFKQYVSLSQELSSALETKQAEVEEVATAEDSEKIEFGDLTKSAPVIRIVSVIVRHAIEGGASDIHIEPMSKETRVRYRIDGILHTSLVLPRSIHGAIVARIKVMANLKLDETRIPQDGHIRLIINEKEYDFRVSILPLVDTEKVVMRVLDIAKGAPTIEDLGYEGEQYELVKKGLEQTEGLIVVTGPTGSGKSTTLFSILNIVNKEGVNIATLEDPVEYQIKGINQSQVKPEIGYTFASGLRSFLRQDPDIIMVGEIRDQETGELAVHAAMTGHLVFSTIHTMDAIGIIGRLLDMGIEPFLLGSTLKTVIAQRLVRKICTHCKEEEKIPEDLLKEIKQDLSKVNSEYIKTLFKDYQIENLKFFKGKGCPDCGNTGYHGRVAISEVLDINKEIKEIINNGKDKLSVETVRQYQKFISIKQDGIIKALKGVTTLEEVLRVMRD
jgi:type IV pilus assembly protein PilB